MCLRGLKTLKHEESIRAYKFVVRLTNGELASLVDKTFKYYSGTFIPNHPNNGLHSFKDKEFTCVVARMVASSVSCCDKDIKSICVISCTIPASANTKVGYLWAEDQVGYESDKLTVDETVIKEYPRKNNIKEFGTLFNKYCRNYLFDN